MSKKRTYSNGNVGRHSTSKIPKTFDTTSTFVPQAGSSSSVDVVPEETREVAQGLKKTNHGVIFQLKLLILFLVRGIDAGYEFQLGTEMEDIGGKFDDLIFKYEVGDASDGGKHYRYQYLQAKHKQDKLFKITAAQLLNDKDGDFSLLKYFRSHCSIQSRGDDVEDYIICTNIGFNLENLRFKRIELVNVQPSNKVFTFSKHPSIFNHYKITVKPDHELFKKLLQDSASHKNEIVSDFLDKLVFVVNAPNEVVLGQLLTEEIGQHYELHEASFVSDFILRKMLDWFKDKKSNFMTLEQGNDILRQGKQNLKSLYMTSVSINYQNELRKGIEFNADAIAEMVKTLKTLLSSRNKIERLKTALPERTAVKLSAALKKFKRFKRKDSYLMTSSERLKEALTSFEDTLKSNHFYQLVVVVCRDGDGQQDSYYENLMGHNQPKRKVIVLCSNGVAASDDLKFADLSDECKTTLLGKEVSFQGTIQTVGDLINNGNREEVIDADSIEQLLQSKGRVHISEYNIDPGFDQELYVKRQFILPFDDKSFEALAAKCTYTKNELLGEIQVTVRNNIEWLNDDCDKSDMWKNIKVVLRERQRSAHSSRMDSEISEKDLTPAEEWVNRVVVVSDVAGTGKSTILWNYYRQMRKDKPDHWIIKLDLVDYITALNQFNSDEVDQQSEAIKFFIANIPNVQESALAQSLVRHRLKTGERIVVMLDGFDEIDIGCQDKCIALIKAIRLTGLNALYITTRPHCHEKLQDSLFQLAYTLRDFSEQDQINYLSRCWQKKHPMLADPNIIRSVATFIVDRLSKSLNDNERSFIGIPLQCHIVSECFEYQINEIIEKQKSHSDVFQDIDSNLNLATLYKRLFEKKRNIYRDEKAKASQVDNHILRGCLEDQMENLEIYLTDLAVKTLVSEQEKIDCLLGESHEPKATIKRRQEKQEMGSVCFGLLTLNRKDEFQFLHQTYAEYLMANYLYEAFRHEEDRRNKLLDKKSIRELIGSEILVGPQYEGVQLFFDSMLNEIVSHVEWLDMWPPINHSSPNSGLPKQFIDFTNDMYRTCVEKPTQCNALSTAVERNHANIFELLCKFVELILKKENILQLMNPLFRYLEAERRWRSGRHNLLNFFYERKHNGLVKLIDWHVDAHSNNILLMLKAIYIYVPTLKFQDSRLKNQDKSDFCSQLLDFMMENKDVVQKGSLWLDGLWYSAFYGWETMLTFFFQHVDYGSLLRPFVRLLLETSGVSTLVYIIKSAFEDNEDVFKLTEVEKLSEILIELKPTDILTQLPRKMLVLAPKPLNHVYSHHRQSDRLLARPPEEDDDMMSKLNEKVFQEETTAVQHIFGTVSKDLHSSDQEKKKVADKLVHYMTYRTGSNPFTLAYLAAACGQINMFDLMLKFVKEVVPSDKLQTALISKNGFLHGAFWDAMEFEKIEMLELIMKSVKQIMGPESQLNLMKSRRLGIVNCHHLINVLAKTMTENDRDGFKCLNNLIFHDERNIEALGHLNEEYFIESISALGRDEWVKRLFDSAIQIPGDFIVLLSQHILVKFEGVELECFLKVITSTSDERTRPLSVWAKLVRDLCKNNDPLDFYASCLEKMFKYIKEKLDANSAKRLVLSDNGGVIEWVTLRGYAQISDVMLAALPPTDREDVTQSQAKNIHQIECQKFLSEIPMSWEKPHLCYSNTVQIIRDCLEKGSAEQLARFADSASFVYNIQDKQFSIWNTFSDSIFTNNADFERNMMVLMNLIAKKLDAEAIQKLILHDIGKGAFFVRVMLWEGQQYAQEMFDVFPVDLRQPMDAHLKNEGPKIIKKMFFSFQNATEKLILKFRKLGRRFSMNVLQFFLDHGDAQQLSLFIETITSVRCMGSSKRSLWGTASLKTLTTDNTINEFLGCVNEKLGKEAFEKLVFHKDNDELDVVIIYALRKSWPDKSTAMFTRLDDEGRERLCHLVDSLSSHTDVVRYGYQFEDNWKNVQSDASE